MRRSFAINTEPHVAEIGDTELFFQPEVMGDEFLDAYTALQKGRRAGYRASASTRDTAHPDRDGDQATTGWSAAAAPLPSERRTAERPERRRASSGRTAAASSR